MLRSMLTERERGALTTATSAPGDLFGIARPVTANGHLIGANGGDWLCGADFGGAWAVSWAVAAGARLPGAVDQSNRRLIE